MKILISPAKKLNEYDSLAPWQEKLPTYEKTLLHNFTEELVNNLKEYKEIHLEKLMNISQQLAKLNYERYQNWERAKKK